MRPAARLAAQAPAALLAPTLLALGTLGAWQLARDRSGLADAWPGLTVFLGVAAAGIAAAWGLARRKPRALALAAGVFALVWLSNSTWLVLEDRAGFASDLTSTIRQHGALVVLVGGAFLLAAWARGLVLAPRERAALVAVALLLALVALAGFAFGAPGRGTPGAPLAVALGLGGALVAGWGHARRHPGALLAGGALLLAAACAGTLWHLALDVDKPVALVSYGGPAGLALAPALALLAWEARTSQSA